MGLGAKFLEKSYFNPIGSHFARAQSHLKEVDFLHFKFNRKNLTVQSSFYLQLKSKTRLKSCITVQNFNCKWFGPCRGKKGTLPPAIF